MQNPPGSSDPISRHLFEKHESLPELLDALTAITEEKTYAVYLELESDFILAPAKTGKPFKVHKSNELAFEMRKYQAKPVLDVCRIIQEESKAFLNAPCGCIHGDAEIGVNRAGKGFKISLKDLVARVNGQQTRYTWDLSIPTYVQRREDDGTIRLGKIKEAWFSGVKPTFLITAGAYSTKATGEHPFLTEDGWKKLSELRVGDKVYVKNPNRKLASKAKKRSYIRRRAGHHPHATSIGVVNEHQLVVEADQNGLSYADYLARLKANELEGITFIDTKTHSVHHKDRNDKNNELSNLQMMTRAAHHKLHSDEDKSISRVLFRTQLVSVDVIEPAGECETYDIEVEDDPHNFIADNFVVHNTGKTVMSLAISEQLGAESVVILVDQRKLAEQWEARINEFVPGATVEQFHSKASKIDSIFQSQARFKVVVAQSLMTRDFTQNPVKCDLLLVDEAHVFSAPRFCQSMYNLDYRASLGLSATPDRKDGLEWVFHRFLGIRQVVVNATTMKATVISPKIKVDLDPDDYQSNWCARDHRMTWYARCTQCEHFAGFPRHCGGNLPDDGHGNVRWAGERFMWTPMLVDLTDNTKYLDQYLPVIKTFFDRGRNVLVFNQFVAPLNYLFEKTKLLLGEEACGVYTSKTKNSDAALEKQLTFVTYKIAQKGLDVPWKDSAILSSPVSDIRQTVGRITRTKEGKQAPLVFDPTITNIPMLRSQATKRRNQYKGLGFNL